MIYVFYVEENKEIGINFDGEKFGEILEIFKDNYFKYNVSKKYWTSSNFKIYDILKYLKNFDKIQILDQQKIFSIFAELEKSIEKEKTRFERVPFNEELLIVPPLKGIYPNENYQVEDIKRGICQNRLLLAHEQGLGKTYILINILNHLWYYNKIDKILIVTPPEALYNWRRELLRFSSFFKEDDILISTAHQNKNFMKYVDKNIIITTYRHFLSISDYYYKFNHKGKLAKKYKNPPIPFYKWGSKRAVILDESHLIKNYKSGRQSYVLHLHKEYFYYRYLATGTPDPNGIAGYYSQIKFLDNYLLIDNYYNWLSTIADIGNKYSKYYINEYIPDKVEKFIEQINPLVIRRYAKDCLKLPELLIKKVYVPLNDLQKDIYIGIIKSTFSKVYEENKNSNIVKAIVDKFPFLSLALDNPLILKGNIVTKYDFGKEVNDKINNFTIDKHSKIEVVDSLVNNYLKENNKLIIWSGHPITINSLAERYKKYKPIVIHGQLDIPKGANESEYRDQLLNKFRTSNSNNLLIASYKVLSTAVNIVEANVAIYFDRSYDLKDWLQSMKRIHRFGQDKKVIVYPIIIEKTLDERLDRNLTFKEDINKNLFNREILTKEEWEKIFLGE